jgi:hypothetical protein
MVALSFIKYQVVICREAQLVDNAPARCKAGRVRIPARYHREVSDTELTSNEEEWRGALANIDNRKDV